MNRKALYLARQILIGIVALQFLNMSVGSEAYWDNYYDYSYAYNKSYDPTETAVELIIEIKYGQQPGFTYDHSTDTGKNMAGAFHWHTDLQVIQLPCPHKLEIKCPRREGPVKKILSPSTDIVSPPPKPMVS
jgi:hypothetical protein